MRKQIARLRVGLVILLGSLLFCSAAFAMGDFRSVSSSDNSGYSGEEKYYYRNGQWYKQEPTGNQRTVADVVMGALVGSIPPQATTVNVQGNPYYYDNQRYYRQLSDGSYVVVQPPVNNSTVEKYFYQNGQWYRRDTTGNQVVVTNVNTGALVGSLPPQRRTINIQGNPYYYDNQRYYRKLSDGSYVVVQPPIRRR